MKSIHLIKKRWETEPPACEKRTNTKRRRHTPIQNEDEENFQADYEDDGLLSDENTNENRSRSFDEGELTDEARAGVSTEKSSNVKRKTKDHEQPNNLEDALIKMQEIVNKKGYIGASEMKVLTEGLEHHKRINLPEKFVVA